MKIANVITLTTDFGLKDPYVGQMKGAILRRNPTARIVDLNHFIPIHDIFIGAMTIATSYKYFPSGTLHLGIVDPGVGSQRSIIAATDGLHLFVAPDNGLLAMVDRENGLEFVYRVDNSTLFPSEISNTFHGRDIMAPVAAALANGMPLAEVGSEIDFADCVQLELPEPMVSEDRVTGQIVYIDRFGNMRTSITCHYLSEAQPTNFKEIVVGNHVVSMITTTYGEQEPGKLTGLIDSAGYVEIALNQGNAAEFTGCGLGDMVTLFLLSCK